MTITLSLEELVLVRHELQRSLDDVRVEIRHTHESDLREELRHRESTLRGLLGKLGSE